MHAVSRWAWILLAVGALSVLAAHWLNRPAVWRPVVIEEPSQAADVSVELVPGRDYEVSIEFRRDIARSDYRRLTASTPVSLIDGEWSLRCEGTRVAGGGTANYLRIRQVRSWKVELYRNAARVPFGVDEVKYHTFGIVGIYLSERVAGALTVPVESGGECNFQWLPQATIDGSRIVVRRSEDDWRAHSRRYSILALGGASSAMLGVLAGLIAFVSGRISRRRRESAANH